jgi:hypothetical protein
MNREGLMNSNAPADRSERYFIRVRGKVLGPFTLEKLKSLRSRGQFSRIHEFSTDRVNWQPATSLESLLGFTMETSAESGPRSAEAYGVVNRDSAAPLHAGPGPVATWHYSAGGERHGPVSILDLRELMRNGLLGPDDLVWKDGLPDWIPIAEVDDLQALTKSSASSPQVNAPIVTSLVDDGIHRTSGFAVASIVLGILGLMTPFLIFNILATVFGSVALKAIGKSRLPLGGRGMALSGLIMGIVGLAVWGLLILFWTGILTSLLISAGFSSR